MVGRWQVPVADLAVTLMGFEGYEGEAMAMGERTPIAVLDGPASGRMAVGEALTNIAAARIGSISRVKLSANWMAAAGQPGEDAALFDTVKAVGLELCPALGVSIPVGKDSLSMRTTWQTASGDTQQVTAPLSLIVTAFARVEDARGTLTPELRRIEEDTRLLIVDLGAGRNRLAGSVLAQVYDALGESVPDVDDARRLRAFFETVQALNADGRVLAYHDRSDGGLVVTLAEMMFATRVGLNVEIGALTANGGAIAALFTEELGAVLQVHAGHLVDVADTFRAAGLGDCVHEIGTVNREGYLRVFERGEEILTVSGPVMQKAWTEMSHAIQKLRDNPGCADDELARLDDIEDPGLHAHLTFDAAEDIAAPFIATGARPRVAILREQGVNGQMEMAAAFHRAGFEAVDVHMSDILGARTKLSGFRGLAACGGFSYGDVLGAGEGWAKSILFHSRAHDEFEGFFAREDTFGLGVCNGCQMMSNLHDLIPGARDWPHFVRNASEQFEARVAMVEVMPSPSIFLAGMAGSRIPVVVSHGEGRAEFATPATRRAARPLYALCYTDNRGAVTEAYPMNPNGSPEGVAGLTTSDGRFTVMMPHPERVHRTVQMSWHPEGWGEDSPWMRMFRNARRWVG
jgi:phosphoribosylformylglycinamidine synthase